MQVGKFSVEVVMDFFEGSKASGNKELRNNRWSLNSLMILSFKALVAVGIHPIGSSFSCQWYISCFSKYYYTPQGFVLAPGTCRRPIIGIPFQFFSFNAYIYIHYANIWMSRLISHVSTHSAYSCG